MSTLGVMTGVPITRVVTTGILIVAGGHQQPLPGL